MKRNGHGETTEHRGSTTGAVSSWQYLPLSEHRVVKQLIRTRCYIDKPFQHDRYGIPGNDLETSGVFFVNEDIVCTYIDLDRLIAQCGLTELEMQIVTDLMDGFTVRDIVEEFEYTDRSGVHKRLDQAVEKIVQYNEQRWMEAAELAHRRRCAQVKNQPKNVRGKVTITRDLDV